MELSIIIPVFHEEKNIEKVLRKISKNIKTPYEVLIIYDTASDPTYSVVKKYKKKSKQVMQLIQNSSGNGRGVMNAIKTGFSFAKGDAVVVVMADLSDDISQIDKMYGLIKKGYGIVCASRFMKNGQKIGGTFLKNLLSKTADISLHYFIGLPTHDGTNAYKMYSRKLLDSIIIESTGGFEYSLEITLKAFFKGFKITEIPTVWKDREAGKSNFQLRKWLPQYIRWYLWGIQQKFSISFVYLLYLFFTVGVTTLFIGSKFVNKIVVDSGLDLSWQTDAVERFLHGFIAGKDYIFTYGPLFQWIHAIPSVLWHVPSFVAVPLTTITLSFFVALSILYIGFSSGDSRFDKLTLPGYLLFVVGVIPLLSGNGGIRFLIPLVYACLWFSFFVSQKFSFTKIIMLSLIPSIVGAYVYDLFPQTVIIGVLAVLFLFFQKDNTLQKKIIYSISFFVGIVGFQLLTSLLISRNFSYTKDSLVTLSDYFYVMNTVWEKGKSNFLFIFPFLMVLFTWFIHKSTYISSRVKMTLFFLCITALTQLRTSLVRSDTGHILAALYPSILVTFILLYYLIKTKKAVYILLFILLFTSIPFRDNEYAYLSGKNIKAIVSIIRNGQKTTFAETYTFPKEYDLAPAVRAPLLDFIATNKGEVLVYPYDTFLLNSQNTTFNTYALQLYDYSNSSVEQKTIKELSKKFPKYIILQLDGSSTFALDGIPNFTRNPLFTKWLIKNYSVFKKVENVLILTYTPNKPVAQESTSLCAGFVIQGDFTDTSIVNKIKPSQYYFVYKGAFRLPVKPGRNIYTIIARSSSAEAVSNLFNSHNNLSKTIEDTKLEKEAKIVSINLFNQVTFYPNTKIYCIQ
jgi:glycosyltransferase involved in cell wall biosynthesis